MVALDDTWAHLLALGGTCCHLVALADIWLHLLALGGTWCHLGAPADIWLHLLALGRTCRHLVALAATWWHLLAFRGTCCTPSVTKCHQVPPSATECHQVSPTVTKCDRVSPGATGCAPGAPPPGVAKRHQVHAHIYVHTANSVERSGFLDSERGGARKKAASAAECLRTIPRVSILRKSVLLDFPLISKCVCLGSR